MIPEMNFYISKIQQEHELCIKRSQRLEGDDEFARAKVYKRPSTKAKVGGSLYVENLHPPPISAIRQDDIEVWLRRQTYLNKCFRVFYKYLDKLKWLPVLERFEIFKESLFYAKEQREDALELQKNHIDELAVFSKKDIKRKFATDKDLEEVRNTYHYIIYREKVLNKADEIKHAMNFDHERLASFISNSLELQIDILQRSKEYDIHGNIDLDQGYSFLYQIAIFFPMQFQKQVIKTTFKPYDSKSGADDYEASNLDRVTDFQGKGGDKVPIENMIRGVKPAETQADGEGEGDEDKNKVPMMTPIDSVTDLKSNIEYKHVISPQLKDSDWLHLCGKMLPQVKDYMKRQIGFLNNENPIDLLLKFSYDLTCGVQDISIMNALVEDIAKKHQFCVEGSLKQFLKVKEFEEVKYKDTTQLYSQFMDALENNLRFNFPDAFNVIKQAKRAGKKSANHFFNLPEHLIHAYYMLRHLKIRDYKIKIQYALNYFRSVQRRLAFDLHEMSTRDTILGDQEFKPPAGASRISLKNLANDTSAGSAGNSKKQQLAKAKAALERQNEPQEMNEASEYNYIQGIYNKAKEQSALNELGEDAERSKHPVDRKKYRYKNKLRNKFISTCPVMSRYHTSFGYNLGRISEAEEYEYFLEQEGNMENSSKRFMGRQDKVEFRDNQEILVKDDFGIYIMYDCVEADMDLLKDDLLLTGSFFIKQQEPLMDSEDSERLNPSIDRLTCLEDLMKYESKFQYKKARLLNLYMESYEHIVDPLEQQRFIQLITNLMAERPRLNLDS